MFRSYILIALRNLRSNRGHSFINIAGLSVGMAVALLIGLWIWDELSFNKYHQHYDRIAQVMLQETRSGRIGTGAAIPLPLDAEMRKMYGSDFRHIVMASWTENHILIIGDKKLSVSGSFMGADAPEMLTLQMVKGSRNGLRGSSGILVSSATAHSLFGDTDPMGQVIRMDDRASFTVSGVYEDLPGNSSFHALGFMAPWDFYAGSGEWIQRNPNDWTDNSLMMYVQVADHADMGKVSEKIRDIERNKMAPGKTGNKPVVFLHPMRKWHLYSTFSNGVNTGGAIQYVWLFGIIGSFVLLLACINFMNLSTARSEKRAREVGIRKAIGSLRGQLIGQFFCESLMTTTGAFVISILLVGLSLPFFNAIAGKDLHILWTYPLFWVVSIVFILFTGVIAGSYPALYLSSFQPVSVLKGAFKTGPLAAVPRKVLVVLQFTVSVILIIGTIVVFSQIQWAKNRPVGYTRDGLIDIGTTNGDLYHAFNSIRADLQKAGVITEMTGSSSPATGINNYRGDVSWRGKDPAIAADFANIHVSSGYGRTLGWQFTAGRDFSSQLTTDSSAVVLNEAAVKYMGLVNPIGEVIQFGKKPAPHTVIGVIKDMVMGSPYEPVKQAIYAIGKGGYDDIIMKINPNVSTHEALGTIAAVCKVYSPSVPFSYRFVDEEYAKKFREEERIGKLSSVFSALAIFISCLGLFGMASFMAEQRMKEIGIRKVLGASVFNLWGLLSRDFVVLVVISLFIAMPVAYYFMSNWLRHYEYHSDLPGWAFAAAGAGALAITILTVSYQSIKTALMNPVKSLGSNS